MSRGGAGRLAEIALFLDAAALGSFSAAGRKHGLTPAAASAAIARLETALGVTLFERILISPAGGTIESNLDGP